MGKSSGLPPIPRFQFTHPGGVRLAYYLDANDSTKFQFTHPGGVRHQFGTAVGRMYAVSIHAPGRGATPTQPFQPPATGVSIHAPGRGATYAALQCYRACVVSIHAPGRGATKSTTISTAVRTMFQFTHPGGVRHTGYQRAWHLLLLFQFTHPGGVRLNRILSSEDTSTVSIHAPGRGATIRGAKQARSYTVSIHAPGRGATLAGQAADIVPAQFQFTHPGGVRL